ncbi:hypothetical protein [uncultured Rikenella sp.]|uniref:hypothetical protein n=1 Tax=uncultured Rikenella sp. TaxID=368003 RepID=UPI00272C8897|nr:hypothetical protein [uncultured Rikenella sp.]
MLARFDWISPARTKNWAELIKRYAVSLRPAGAPIGRFIRVIVALLAVRRPRRAVSGGTKLDRAPPPQEGNRQNVLARFDKISQGARKSGGAKAEPQ